MNLINTIKSSVYLWFVGNHFRPIESKDKRGNVIFKISHPARKHFISNNFKKKSTAQKACDVLNRKLKKGILDKPAPKPIIAMRPVEYK